MSRVNSFNQSLFNFLDSLDKIILIGAELQILRASRKFKPICVTKMWLIWLLYVDIISVVDWTQSVRETV